MLWHLEFVTEVLLVFWMIFRQDDRKWFEALLSVNVFLEMFMMLCERSGNSKEIGAVWYVCVALEIPLTALALIESCSFRPNTHRNILCWWVAVTMGCAWIRFYPYTGMATLIVNEVAFLAWLWEKAQRTRWR